MKRYIYDTGVYNFAYEVKKIFGISNLDQIHKKLPESIRYDNLHKLGEDNKTWYHKKFYKPINEGSGTFMKIYEDLIHNEVSKILSFDCFLYQKVPTFRVHTPNNIAVGGWHRDRDYNHSTHEINFFLPLNRAYESSTIWVESAEDKADYSPINCTFGDLIMWDGANLIHGNKPNITGKSRVSVDFRVLEYSKYSPDKDKKTVSMGKSLILGEYFKLKEIK